MADGRVLTAATKVALADDHPLFLTALRTVLEEEGIEVVGAARRGDELLDLVAQEQPDAVLLDLEMPRMDGMTCLGELRSRWPAIRVVILSAHDADERVAQALAAGAAAFVGKTAEADEIAALLRGETPRRGSVRPLRPTPDHAGLTRREIEILRLAAEGHSNAALARMLWVVEPTVKFHLSNVYRKLGVANRMQAALRARDLGLLDDRPRRAA
jgi:DNA-binding NarL/FixJ family response regulator